MDEQRLHLFVYYKVPADQAVALQANASAVLEAGRPFAQHAQLLRRPTVHNATQTAQPMHTWMEMYLNVTDLPALQAAISTAAQVQGLSNYSPRHSEVFEDFAS